MSNWKFRKPTKSGYYWVYFKDGKKPEIVSVQIENGDINIYFVGNDTPSIISKSNDPFWKEDKESFRGALWSEPLCPPPFDKSWLMWLKDKIQRKHSVDIDEA